MAALVHEEVFRERVQPGSDADEPPRSVVPLTAAGSVVVLVGLPPSPPAARRPLGLQRFVYTV